MHMHRTAGSIIGGLSFPGTSCLQDSRVSQASLKEPRNLGKHFCTASIACLPTVTDVEGVFLVQVLYEFAE